MNRSRIKFDLNPSFYKKAGIERTIAEFSEFGRFSIEQQGNRIIISYEPKDGLEEKTIKKVENEFRNHVLASGFY